LLNILWTFNYLLHKASKITFKIWCHKGTEKSSSNVREKRKI